MGLGLIRALFGAAFKTNDSLEFVVLTGCLRISKENIFTGLNNFSVYTVMDVQYNKYFGFTDAEVKKMLGYYGFMMNPSKEPQNYWVNTSSNDIVRQFIDRADATTKDEIEQLINGEHVKKQIHQKLTYRDLDSSIDNLWSLLFTTGYL